MVDPFHLLIYQEIINYIHYLEGAVMKPVRDTKLTEIQTCLQEVKTPVRALESPDTVMQLRK